MSRDFNKKPVLLDDRETFELYEKRSLRSPVGQPISQPQYITPIYDSGHHNDKHHNDHLDGHVVIEPDDLMPSKRKFPLPWVIGAAIGVPLFVIITLFLAVWFQEMGFI